MTYRVTAIPTAVPEGARLGEECRRIHAEVGLGPLSEPLAPLPRVQLALHGGEHSRAQGAVRLAGEATQTIVERVGYVLHLQMGHVMMVA